HFSRQAAAYGRHRPRYPSELAAHLAAVAPGRGLAIDLATGNGQAALDLAAHFERVLASDASASQLAHAVPHPRVRYVRHAAECLPVRSGSADLVAVAQAAHWFDLERFYAEARRVLRPHGVVALWTYELLRIDAPIDAVLGAFYRDVVRPYWPAERRYVEEGYRTLPFPLEEFPAPPFEAVVDWSLDDVLGYVATWSAVDRYRTARGEDPLPALAARLAPPWSDGATRQVRWAIHLRIGRI
ncbi:MAG TPA: class I SAM-dependent methyltransferase, partial [Steroidobacteraceae bacterium]|nr:class I SAM-dependent methyltransferase [Steroidobacteraceae bacterium]